MNTNNDMPALGSVLEEALNLRQARPKDDTLFSYLTYSADIAQKEGKLGWAGAMREAAEIIGDTENLSAVVKFSHGEIRIEGTVIFILAQIADNEKREGWISTTKNQALQDVLDAAEQRRAQRGK